MLPPLKEALEDEETFKEESWPKTCSGCSTKLTEDDWENLKYVGIQKSGFDDIPDLELRNCGRCHSTLAIVVPRDFA